MKLRMLKTQSLPKVLTPIFLVLLLTGALLAINFLASSYVQRVITILGINIVFVVSLNLLNGFTGVFSLGQVGFMAIGAYTAAILTLPLNLKVVSLPNLPSWLAGVQLSFVPALLIGAVVSTLVALVIGLSLMRLGGSYVSVATMGFLVIVHVVLINWDSLTRGARTFAGVPPYTTLWWAWGWAALTVYVVWRLVHSSYGRSMRAVRDNEIAAQMLGINIMRTRLLAFCTSAFLAGVAGALWAHYITSFSPEAFYFTETFSLIMMLVIGGMGSISGSILGTVAITLLSEALRNAERGANLGFIKIPPIYGASQILTAAAFIAVIIYHPQGLLGGREFNFRRLLISSHRRGKGKN